MKFKNFSAAAHKLARVCIPWLLLPFFGIAQQNKLIVKPAQQISVHRGASVVERLNLAILPGFHVNSDKPRDEFLIPLKLTWTDGPLKSESISYPKPEETKVGDQMLLVFTGAVSIETSFKAPLNALPGPAVMTGKLRYQACNSDMCFRPATVDVKVPVVIE